MCSGLYEKGSLKIDFDLDQKAQFFSSKEERIVHEEIWEDTDTRYVVTHTDNPKYAAVPNDNYCKLMDVRGYTVVDIYYENIYLTGNLNDRLEETAVDSSFTVIVLRGPKGDIMQWTIQMDPEGNGSGYIGQNYLDAGRVQAS